MKADKVHAKESKVESSSAAGAVQVQCSLTIGAVNDPLEHEADAMADKVMRMQEVPDIAAAGAGGIQRKCAQCEEEEKLQRKPLASFIQRKEFSAGTVASDSVSNTINASKGNDSGMDSDTQSFMQSRFGADFSDVKIHTGGEAIQMNRELNAKAFTVGNDIYFNEGQYNPGSNEGKHLLAHELTHTVQQGGFNQTDSQPTIRRTPADDARVAMAKKLHDALLAKTVNEATVLATLGTLSRDSAKIALLKTTYKAQNTTELEADIKAHIGATNLSRALFLLNAPAAETALTSEVTVGKAGTEDHKATVNGGTVSVRTGVDFTAGAAAYPGGFSLGFSGAKSSESRYIQTIWSEVVATQANKTDLWVNKTGLPTSNNSMDLTTDPKKPAYKVDSGSAISPFYESGFTNARTASGNINYDRPSEFSDVILKQFDAGATKVIERDHFDNFLIQEEKAIYQVTIVVEWIYTTKTAIARSTKFVSGSAITTLPADIRKQILKEYPSFDYIQ